MYLVSVLLLGLGIGCSKGAADEAPASDATQAATASAAAPASAPANATSATATPVTAAGSPAPSPATGAVPADDAHADVVRPDQLPAVVARIDGTEVSKDDLLARANEARGALAQRGMPQPPPTRTFFRQVLDDIIGNRLLFKELSSEGKAATAAEVDEQIASIRSQFPSDEEFDKVLAGRGFDRERLKREVSESITVEKWVRETVIPAISISDAEKHAFYDSNKERMIDPERVHARHILLLVDESASAEEKAGKRKQIDEIRARITAGADFAEVAKQSSEDKGSGANGGDLGWFTRGRMVPPFEQAAFALEPGKLSDVVETRFGFHLIEVLEKKALSELSFEQVADRIDGMLKQRQLEQRVRAHINELSSKAEIDILF